MTEIHSDRTSSIYRDCINAACEHYGAIGLVQLCKDRGFARETFRMRLARGFTIPQALMNYRHQHQARQQQIRNVTTSPEPVFYHIQPLGKRTYRLDFRINSKGIVSVNMTTDLMVTSPATPFSLIGARQAIDPYFTIDGLPVRYGDPSWYVLAILDHLAVERQALPSLPPIN